MTEASYTLITYSDVIQILIKLFLPKCHYKVKILIFFLVLASGIVLVDQRWIQRETFEALVRIDPVPHAQALVDQERYAEAQEYLSFFMEYEYVRSNPEAIRLYEEIDAKRHTYTYRLKKVAEGAIWGKSDEIEGQISAIAIDFLVIGDVRDITLEGIKWAKGEEVDKFTAALSAIGLVATAGSWISAGGTLSTKPGVSFLKTANKLDKVPKWLRKDLIRSAKVIKKTKNLDHVADLLDSVHTLYRTSGVRGTLVLLDKAEDVRSLKKFARFGKTFGKKSATLLDITGDTGLKIFYKMDNVPKKLFLEASTYGEKGILRLQKVGPRKFQKLLRNMKFAARTTKVTYKHKDFLIVMSRNILKNSFGLLPTWILVGIIVYGVAILIRR